MRSGERPELVDLLRRGRADRVRPRAHPRAPRAGADLRGRRCSSGPRTTASPRAGARPARLPFHKYGGLIRGGGPRRGPPGVPPAGREPRDLLAGTRVLRLLPGVGPRTARASAGAGAAHGQLRRLERVARPVGGAGAVARPGGLCRELAAPQPPTLPAQLHRIRAFYGPLCEERYDHVPARLRDLEQLEQLAAALRRSEHLPRRAHARATPLRRRSSPAHPRSTRTTWSSAPSTPPRASSSTRSTCSTPPTGTSLPT